MAYFLWGGGKTDSVTNLANRSIFPNVLKYISHEEIILIYRFGCLRRVTSGDVDITVLEPEELVAIRNYKLYSVLVANELRLFQNGN